MQAHGLQRVGAQIEGGSGKGRHVGVSTGVHNAAGLYRGESLLVGQDNRGYAVAPALHVGDHRVVEHPHPGGAQRAVGLELEALDVEADGYPVLRPAHLADFDVEVEAGTGEVSGGAGAGRLPRQLQDQAAHHRQTGAQVDESVQGGAHHRGDVAPREAAALHHHGARPAPRRGNGRRGAGAPRPHHQDVRLGDCFELAQKLHPRRSSSAPAAAQFLPGLLEQGDQAGAHLFLAKYP